MGADARHRQWLDARSGAPANRSPRRSPGSSNASTKRGLIAFDPEDEAQRNRAIRACVEASLEDLDADELARLCELAVLPEDENVPLDVVEALWAETGGLDEDDADDLVQRFDALSLLQSLDRGARTLRLHDNMIWYLRDRIGAEGLSRRPCGDGAGDPRALRRGMGEASRRPDLWLAVSDPASSRRRTGREG